MKYELKTRQICLFFLAFMPVIKFFMLPSILASASQQDMWISSLFSVLLDGLTLLSLLFVCKKTQKNFFQILESFFSKTVAKIILFLYLIYFFLKAIIPSIEQIRFIEYTLYAALPNLFYVLPLFIAFFYLCTKSLRVVGRSADIVCIFSTVGFSLIIALSISNLDIGAILPIFNHSADKILLGSYRSATWFGDAGYFLFFIGNFKYEKKSGIKILLSYALSGIFVILFMIFFYASFSHIAFRQQFALTEITKYTTVINDTARFDNVATFLMLFSCVFSTAIPLFFASKIIDKIFGVKKTWLSPLIIVSLIFIVTVAFREYVASIQNFIFNYASAFFILMANVLPICTLFLTKKENSREILKT